MGGLPPWRPPAPAGGRAGGDVRGVEAARKGSGGDAVGASPPRAHFWNARYCTSLTLIFVVLFVVMFEVPPEGSPIAMFMVRVTVPVLDT